MTINLPHTSAETWDALVACDLARLEEFEAPESDPAERDPEEAEPTTGANIRSIRGAKLRGIIVARIPNTYGDCPGYSVYWEDGTVSVIGDGFELDVCPIHGAGCEAWS